MISGANFRSPLFASISDCDDVFKDRKALVVHLWAHKGDSGGESEDEEEDEESKKKEQYMNIIRENKIKIKRGDFGVLPWFIENKDDEQDASAKGEIKADNEKSATPIDRTSFASMAPDDDDDSEEDDDEERRSRGVNAHEDGRRPAPAVPRFSAKKLLAYLDVSTPGRSKRKASNVAKTSMRLVSRLSSADGFDGVDHEDSGDGGDGDDEDEGESTTTTTPTASEAASTTTTEKAEKKKRKFANITSMFNPALYFADRLKFLCCGCKKKFEKESDKSDHLSAAHGGGDEAYEAEEKRKNESFLPEFSVGDIDTFWTACRESEFGGFECAICEEKAPSEEQSMAHFWDRHIPELRKKAWKPQRKQVHRYLREQRQAQRGKEPRSPTPPPPTPKSSKLKLAQPQAQPTSDANYFRYIFANTPTKMEDGGIEPRTFLEMAGCGKCSLYFSSRTDRKRHSKSAHADDPLPKFETAPKGAVGFRAADAKAMETLKSCSCLDCGLFFCSSLFREKHICPVESTSPAVLEEVLKSDLMPAYTPKQYPKCLECRSEFVNEIKKAQHNYKGHGHNQNDPITSDDESDADGKEGPGYESILQLYGCGPCGKLFGSMTAVDEHRLLCHGGEKAQFDPASINFDQLQYEDGSEHLLEARACVPCRIYFAKPELKEDHIRHKHDKDFNHVGKLTCDLKPAHTPGRFSSDV